MTTLSCPGGEVLSQNTANVDRKTRPPISIFHRFPWLPTELRVEIWETSAITSPLQVHSFLVEQCGPEEDDEFKLRYPHMLEKCLKSHIQRIDTVLPLLHTCSESRRTTFTRYSLVPLRDLLTTIPPVVYSGWDELDGMLRNFNFAVDWHQDTIFCNENFPFPSPDLPWAKYFRNATKLCMPLDEMMTFDVDWDESYEFATDLEKMIGDWVRSVLPIFSMAEEITFAITNILEKEHILNVEYWAGPQLGMTEGERRFTPLPHICVVGSDLDGGSQVLHRYPLEPTDWIIGDKHGNGLFWWESLLQHSIDSMRTFEKEIKRERPGMKLGMALDYRIVDNWIVECRETIINAGISGEFNFF
ncbi:hypothetical protein E0Z10_g4678 [Xylaria hypoxylon]|uniref:2EXR domain-containing protein n=1 Tax=Xylaria hypoxylon TaxID=37992 RepID=A0A4Z0YKI7_9PEZI|nr:hypothetical protein E0Z10_g4678 [Xylaria hypoxylon]